MKKKFCLMLGVCLLMAQFAQAGTISYGTYADGSTIDWTTNDAVHRDDPSILASYVLNNPDSMTMTGVYGDDSWMVAPLSLNVGDVLSYDYYLTKEMRDPVGDGDTDWIGDATAGPRNAADEWVFYALFDDNHVWLNSWAGGWADVSVADATAPTTGLHFEYVFDSASQYTLTVTALGNGVEVGSWTDSVYMTDISLIDKWRLGLWDSEQDVTVENFTVTPIPEPATMMLLGLGGLSLGGLSLIRRRRKA